MEDLEAIRQDVSSVLRHSKPLKPNLSRDEYIALTNLRKNPDITIVRADKGNSTVIMDRSDYNQKIEDLLSDQSTYKLVKINPTNKIVTKTKELLSKYSDTLQLNDCVELVKRRLNDHKLSVEYAELLEHCLTSGSGYLYWENKFYTQIDGVAMGSAVSPVVADIFMEDLEEKALSTSLVMPKIFKRPRVHN